MALDDVQQLLDTLKDAPRITEFSVTGSGGTITLKRGALPPITPLVPMAFPEMPETAPAPPAEDTHYVTATMVGLFHETRPPLAAGETLTIGQVVGVIESMRLMNDLTAGQGGIVAEVFISEGQPVEYGQPLFRIRTASPSPSVPSSSAAAPAATGE